MNNFKYIIYRLDYFDGCFYIGKADDGYRRYLEHKRGFLTKKTLKYKVGYNQGARMSVIWRAPSEYSDAEKQIMMDNAERFYIHKYARETYNKLTGQNTNYTDYSPYRAIINRKMLNTQLY